MGAHLVRPRGVTLLGAFFCFGALMSGLAALSLVLPGSLLTSIWVIKPGAHEELSRLGVVAPALLLAVSAACGAAAFGFFDGRRWGYWLGIVLLVVNLAGDLANATVRNEPLALVGIPVIAVLLWYLARSKVKTFFKFDAHLPPGGSAPTKTR